MQNPKNKRDDFVIDNLSYSKALAQVSEKQSLIAISLRNKDYKKATKVSRSLVRTKAARFIAVHRVITNKGYKSKGLSKSKPKTVRDYQELISKLWEFVKTPKSYKASPLSRIYFIKPNGSKRPISIPTYLDRSIQALYHLALDVWSEENSDQHSYGFRKYRSPQWAAACAALLLTNGSHFNPPQWILELDIRKCYDTISHDWLMENIPFIPREILKEWLKSGFIEKEFPKKRIHETEGIPQGGIISPTIANMTLDGMTDAIKSYLLTKFKKQKEARCSLVRYANDAIIIIRSRLAALYAIEAVREFLKPRGLEINEQKTKITDRFSSTFDFTGFRYKAIQRGEKIINQYSIPPEKTLKLFKKLRKLEDNNIYELLTKANLIAGGFANYYCKSNSSRQLQKIGSYLSSWFYNKLMFLYAKTSNKKYLGKHPEIIRKKSKTIRKHALHVFVKRKHYGKRAFRGNHHLWWFANKKNTKKFLTNPGRFRVKPGWFQSGLSAYHPKDATKLLKICLTYKQGLTEIALKNTAGQCAICNLNVITEEIEWDIHHKKPRFLGGNSTKSNLICLCKNCHLLVSKSVQTRNLSKCTEFVDHGILSKEVLSWINSLKN